MLQAEHREDGESCARLTKVQQPPALAADGIRKFNRSYVLNAAASEPAKARCDGGMQRAAQHRAGLAARLPSTTRSPAVTPGDRIRSRRGVARPRPSFMPRHPKPTFSTRLPKRHFSRIFT